MDEYINRDEVLSMSYCTNKPTWDNPHLYPKSVVDVEDIESLPAADVVEVVHSKWIKRNNERKCPECGFFYLTNGTTVYNLCPMCGAKMDGERRSENDCT